MNSQPNASNAKDGWEANDLSQKIDNLQYQISRLTNLNTVQEKGKFPSQPHQNPRAKQREPKQEQRLKQRREERKQRKEERSSTKKEDLEAKVNEKPKRTINQENEKSTCLHLSPSFAWQKGINNASEILEVLRQVKVNIPLLDMIKQVPTYAKFLKDLCTIKRGLNVSKKAFLTEQMLEDLNEIWDLDEGLPEPLDCLLLPPLKMRKKFSLYSMRRRHKKR
ncbi:hypothetical protein CK203_064785 [Vitis vinifera]|uniref:Uncharacterized protein n=1 Tax=Vitis vinifera TaxID=29760 RepID=A0A438FQ03_VITVI|nr:hypothetical protein CK203_064785 [Vitis vinifera]